LQSGKWPNGATLAHTFDPEKWLTFIELRGFGGDWKHLGLTDEDLWAAQAMIQLDPKGWPVIAGTGGLRKLRFSTHGKSGRKKAARICYVYFDEVGVVLLIVAYAKSEADNISPADKKYFRQLIEREQAILSQRKSR